MNGLSPIKYWLVRVSYLELGDQTCLQSKNRNAVAGQAKMLEGYLNYVWRAVSTVVGGSCYCIRNCLSHRQQIVLMDLYFNVLVA
jgi:hypothetical protein